MNQKEYEVVAGVIKGRIDNAKHLNKIGWSDDDIATAIEILEDLISFMVNEFDHTYPKTFDSIKFLRACGL